MVVFISFLTYNMFSTLLKREKVILSANETQLLTWNKRLHGSCKPMFITITDLITTIHVYPPVNC